MIKECYEASLSLLSSSREIKVTWHHCISQLDPVSLHHPGSVREVVTYSKEVAVFIMGTSSLTRKTPTSQFVHHKQTSEKCHIGLTSQRHTHQNTCTRTHTHKVTEVRRLWPHSRFPACNARSWCWFFACSSGIKQHQQQEVTARLQDDMRLTSQNDISSAATGQQNESQF